MSEENTENSLDGFKNLAADIMPAEGLDIKEVNELPEQDRMSLGDDTGVVDLTVEDSKLTTDKYLN